MGRVLGEHVSKSFEIGRGIEAVQDLRLSLEVAGRKGRTTVACLFLTVAILLERAVAGRRA